MENYQKVIDKKMQQISELNADIFLKEQKLLVLKNEVVELEKEIKSIKEQNSKDLSNVCFFCAERVNEREQKLNNGRTSHSKCLITNYDRAKKEGLVK